VVWIPKSSLPLLPVAESLLQQTSRATPAWCRPKRMIAVVTGEHEGLARTQIARLAPEIEHHRRRPAPCVRVLTCSWHWEGSLRAHRPRACW